LNLTIRMRTIYLLSQNEKAFMGEIARSKIKKMSPRYGKIKATYHPFVFLCTFL
jgi:hypothetical protein